MKKIWNWGIIGPGNIAHRFAEALLDIPDACLKGVASRSESRAKSFATKYNVDKFYSSYANLASDPDIDILYISTPHSEHFEHALLGLQHKKAVLCEKPMTINRQQFLKLRDVAKQNNTFLMEAMWTRFLPTILRVEELVKEGVLGEILKIDAEFCFKADYDIQKRSFNRQLAGGSLLDIGIYPLFLCLLLLGNPQYIDAKAILDPITKVDQTCFMELKFANGAYANLTSSFMFHRDIKAEIWGTKGNITIQPKWFAPTYLTLNLLHTKPQDLEFEYTSNGYDFQALEVMKCLRAGKIESDLMPHSLSLKLIELLDTIRDKAGISYPELE